MIYGITGKPGAGKTYLAVDMAIKAMKKGVPVYSNLHIFGARYASSIINFLNVKKGLIIIDELNVEAGARNIKYLPPHVYRQWSQHRHRGINLIWTAQTINRIDIIMRELTNEVYECHSFANKIFWVMSYQPEELMTPMGSSMVRDKGIIKGFHKIAFFKKNIYSLYSSEEEIVIPPLLAQKMAREWGYIEKDITANPESLPLVNNVKQHNIDFQQVKKSKEKGKKYSEDVKRFLLKVKKGQEVKDKGLPF